MRNNYIKVIRDRAITKLFFFNDNIPTERDKALADARGATSLHSRSHVATYRQINALEFSDVKCTMTCWNGHRYSKEHGMCVRCNCQP